MVDDINRMDRATVQREILRELRKLNERVENPLLTYVPSDGGESKALSYPSMLGRVYGVQCKVDGCSSTALVGNKRCEEHLGRLCSLDGCALPAVNGDYCVDH